MTTEQVWDQFASALRRTIRRRVADEHVADDLLQDAFVRIHQRLDSLTDESRVAAWAHRIAANTVIDYYRRNRTNLTSLNALAEEASQADNTDKRDHEDLARCVASMADTLPETYRQAVILAEMHDAPQHAIAEYLGVSLSAAKSRVRRGRRLLKEMLMDCCRFEFDRRGNMIGCQTRAASCTGTGSDC